jgi:hypothetical protein
MLSGLDSRRREAVTHLTAVSGPSSTRPAARRAADLNPLAGLQERQTEAVAHPDESLWIVLGGADDKGDA